PLRSRDQIMGALMIRSKSPNAYTLHELRLAERLGDQITGAISNSELHKALEIESNERDTLAEISRVISSSPEIDDVFDKFVELAKRLFSFDRIVINRIDLEANTATVAYRMGPKVEERQVGDVFPMKGTTMEEIVSKNCGVLVQGLNAQQLSEAYPRLARGFNAGFLSGITVPLRSQDRIIGALMFRSRTFNAYTSYDLSLAERLGDQVAGVIANSELHKDIERRAAEQQALAKIGRIISGSIDIDEVYESFAIEVKKVLPCDRISIAILYPDGSKTTHSFVSGLDTPDMTKGSVIEVGGTMAEEVISSRSAKIFAFDDVKEYSRRFPGRSPMFELGVRSHVFAPLIANDKVIGLFYAGSKKTGAYSESDRQLAERIGDQIAGAIANSRLHAALERDATERQVLADVGRTMSSSLVISEVFEQFAEQVGRILNFDRIAIAAIDWDRQIISNLHHYGDTVEGRSFGDETPLKGTTVEETVNRDSGVIIQDIPPEEIARLYPGSAAGVKVGFRSFMTVPLRSRDKIIGAIVMRSYRPLAFDQRDLDLAERVADQIAGSVDGSQLYLELKKTEEALNESLDRFDLAAQGSGDGLWDRLITYRGEHGDYFNEDDFVYFSPRFKELLGYEDHEFPDDLKKWPGIIHPDDVKLVKQAVIDHFEHKKPYEVEYRARTKSGEYRWFSSRGQALWDESGRPIRFMGFMRDVTNQKALEAQLMQSQKMDAFGQLAGGVAHDLNNMLSVVMSYTHLAKTTQISETRELHLEEVLKASERAAELISQLLAFSRRQIIKPRTINLNDVVADVEMMIRRLLGEEIRLVTKLDPDVQLVEVDPGQVEQVLVNLAVNSRDAMPKGGTLLIETSSETVDQERANVVGELNPGAYTVITVQDTGTGIPDDVKDHVFEPFFTTKEVGRGIGLGLSTCYGIVAQSGGCITVESVVGKGSTFKIYFPAKEGPTESLPFWDQSGHLPVGTESILIVEDEPLVRNVAVHVLKEQGYTVIEASNGLEALDVVSQHQGGPIDLLLTDMVMPAMGGRILAERLKEIHPEMKVLFTSGYTEDEAFKDEVFNERTNFMGKPFNPSTLTRKVREVLQDGIEGNAQEDLINSV
ncbi:MAG: GAF domain-containing protein, partial [Chloroflexi bacterium]|nr:GAF domain-containing protein [Chloroflexota bacterium]